MKPLITFIFACGIIQALNDVRPGAVWTLANQSYDQLSWTDLVQAKPSQDEINTAISKCQANQVQLATYAVELSTTQTALTTLYPNLVAPTAAQQAQAIRLQARILILKNTLEK